MKKDLGVILEKLFDNQNSEDWLELFPNKEGQQPELAYRIKSHIAFNYGDGIAGGDVDDAYFDLISELPKALKNLPNKDSGPDGLASWFFNFYLKQKMLDKIKHLRRDKRTAFEPKKRMDDIKGALELLKKALAQNPNDIAIQIDIANLYAKEFKTIIEPLDGDIKVETPNSNQIDTQKCVNLVINKLLGQKGFEFLEFYVMHEDGLSYEDIAKNRPQQGVDISKRANNIKQQVAVGKKKLAPFLTDCNQDSIDADQFAEEFDYIPKFIPQPKDEGLMFYVKESRSESLLPFGSRVRDILQNQYNESKKLAKVVNPKYIKKYEELLLKLISKDNKFK